MTFDDALEYLGIADFRDRIWNSNSHGELHHLLDYVKMAGVIPPAGVPAFRAYFLETIKWCEENWQRPESCFQHMIKLLWPQ